MGKRRPSGFAPPQDERFSFVKEVAMAGGRKRPRPSTSLGTSGSRNAARKRARAVWSEALAEQYLALLGETGNLWRAAGGGGGRPRFCYPRPGGRALPAPARQGAGCGR